MVKYFLYIFILFSLNACVSQKEIKLKSVSIVSKHDVENEIMQSVGYPEYCIKTIENINNKPDKISNNFLKIIFNSKDKVFYNSNEREEENINGYNPYPIFLADGKKLYSFGLCNIRKKANNGYVNIIFYPTYYNDYISGKVVSQFNYKKTKRFSFYIKTSGYAKWQTNEIIIKNK